MNEQRCFVYCNYCTSYYTTPDEYGASEGPVHLRNKHGINTTHVEEHFHRGMEE